MFKTKNLSFHLLAAEMASNWLSTNIALVPSNLRLIQNIGKKCQIFEITFLLFFKLKVKLSMLLKSWPQNLKTNKFIGKYVTKFLPCKNAPIGKEYQA